MTLEWVRGLVHHPMSCPSGLGSAVKTPSRLISRHQARCLLGLSPVGRSCLIKYARRLLRRDVGGAIRRSRASGRRLDGERDGSKSRGPCRPVAVKRQQWRWSRCPPSVAQGRCGGDGVRPLASALEAELRRLREGSDRRPERTAKERHGTTRRRRRAGAERQPVGREPPRRAYGPSIGCGVGIRAPVAPSLTRCQRGCWRW
jgi:hypothetical protein